MLPRHHHHPDARRLESLHGDTALVSSNLVLGETWLLGSDLTDLTPLALEARLLGERIAP